ncbi:hypothetical protein CCP1ISM_250013 [Azospirillaceae bacterium]
MRSGRKKEFKLIEAIDLYMFNSLLEKMVNDGWRPFNQTVIDYHQTELGLKKNYIQMMERSYLIDKEGK